MIKFIQSFFIKENLQQEISFWIMLVWCYHYVLLIFCYVNVHSLNILLIIEQNTAIDISIVPIDA